MAAGPVPIKNQPFLFSLEMTNAAGNLITSWTGADSEVSLDHQSFNDCTSEVAEIGTSGVGWIELTAAEMNADHVIYKLTLTNTGTVPRVLHFFPVASTGSGIPVNAGQIGGTTQTGRDIGASVLVSAGTGTGQLDVTSGVIKANLAQILGTALTETAGYLAAAFKKFFNVPTPTLTAAGIDQTGDSYTRIGATGSGLTSLAPAATALSTAQWSNTRAALLDALTLLDVAVSSRAADGAEVTVSSPVAQNGDITVRQNRDYVSAIDTEITWTLTNPPGTTPSAVTFTCRKLSFSKACGYAAGVITLQLTAAETGAFGVGEYAFEVEATISGYAHPGLVEGRMTVERDV